MSPLLTFASPHGQHHVVLHAEDHCSDDHRGQGRLIKKHTNNVDTGKYVANTNFRLLLFYFGQIALKKPKSPNQMGLHQSKDKKASKLKFLCQESHVYASMSLPIYTYIVSIAFPDDFKYFNLERRSIWWTKAHQQLRESCFYEKMVFHESVKSPNRIFCFLIFQNLGDIADFANWFLSEAGVLKKLSLAGFAIFITCVKWKQ
jgi:hypothetical protein